MEAERQITQVDKLFWRLIIQAGSEIGSAINLMQSGSEDDTQEEAEIRKDRVAKLQHLQQQFWDLEGY